MGKRKFCVRCQVSGWVIWPQASIRHRIHQSLQESSHGRVACEIPALSPWLHFCSSHSTAPALGTAEPHLAASVTHRTSTYPAVIYAQYSQLWSSHKYMTIQCQLNGMPRSAPARITQTMSKEKHIPLPGNHRTSIKYVSYSPCREKKLFSVWPHSRHLVI